MYCTVFKPTIHIIQERLYHIRDGDGKLFICYKKGTIFQGRRLFRRDKFTTFRGNYFEKLSQKGGGGGGRGGDYSRGSYYLRKYGDHNRRYN